jgi:hypothetical protein
MNNAFVIIGLLIVSLSIWFASSAKQTTINLPKQIHLVLFFLAIIGLLVSRLWQLDTLPSGLNQDEAAIGYDAWALAQFGIDRNGYPFPILPMSWGSGAGGFIIYLGAIVFQFVPLTVTSLRLMNGVIQVITAFVFYDLIKRKTNPTYGLIALVFIVINPWHVMLSRWNLDSNQVFSLIIIGLWLFEIGMSKNQKRYHFLALTFFALALYSYGSAIVVVPLLLLMIYGHAWLHKSMTFKTILVYGSYFLILSIPILTFYVINLFELESILTPWFSILRFNVLRSQSVFISFDQDVWIRIWNNLKDLTQLLTFGKDDYLWNQLPGFGIAYLYLFPFFFVGFIVNRKHKIHLSMYAWFVSSVVLSLILNQNINRLGVLFIPYLYFLVLGLIWLAQRSGKLFSFVSTLVLTSAVLFTIQYQVVYREQIKPIFAYGYGEALMFSQTLNKSEWRLPSQQQVNGSHVIALFYLQPDPNDVVATGIYLNPGAEFQYLASFQADEIFYRFYQPTGMVIIESDIGYIIHQQLETFFILEDYEVERFGYFTVIWINA